MLEKKEIIKIINSVDKKKLAMEMMEDALDFRGIDGIVFAELDLQTGDIYSRFRADGSLKPEKEKGLWIAKFITNNMDEIPDDLPEEIKNTEDIVAEFYRLYAEHYIEFFEAYDIEENLKELR